MHDVMTSNQVCVFGIALNTQTLSHLL